MEHRSVSELINQYEPLLKRFEADDGIKLTEVEEEAGCKVGDNYMSVVMRTRVKGSRGNGTIYEKSLVTKYLPHHREITKIFNTGDLFKNESYFYEKLLPILGDFGPTCVHADGDKIVMEDLGSIGYAICERQELMDLDHSLATVKTLARLHASSMALKLRDEKSFLELVEPLKEAIFPRDDNLPHLGKSIDDSINAAIEHLEWIEPRSEELAAGIEYLKNYRGSVYSEMQDLVYPHGSKYDVLTHGDCWNNNVMFRHNIDRDDIADVKLLDFQIARHVSPAIDFHYFVYSSAKSEVIETHYDRLVEAYHKAFVDTLTSKSIPDRAIQTFHISWFENELKIKAKYGLFTCCWITPAIFAADDDAIDMDKVTKESIETLASKVTVVKPKFAHRLKSILLNYMRRYV